MLWAMVAVLTVCLTACNNDEPEPQPDEPNTEQEDPDTGQGNQDTEQEENWEGEKPHGFYFDLDQISLPLNDEGLLCFSETSPDHKYITYTLDSIVMEKRFGYGSSTMKHGIVWGPCNVSKLTLKGKRATPFNNVEVYKQMCRTIGVRPQSKFNDFPELTDLPVRKVYSGYTFFQLDTLVSTDIITHKYFNKDCPAGSSMYGSLRYDNYHDHPTYMSLAGASGSMFFDWWRSEYNVDAEYPWRPAVPDFGLGTYTGKQLEYMRCIMPTIDVVIVGYPDEAGDYPMTIYMEFASGRTLSQDFKIRFVEEK